VDGAAAAVDGGGALVEESTSARPDPPQPVTAAASSNASIAVTVEGRAGNRAPRALYPGFPPPPLSSSPT